MLDNNDLQKIEEKIKTLEERLKQLFMASEKRIIKEISDLLLEN